MKRGGKILKLLSKVLFGMISYKKKCQFQLKSER
jgi:hypothetical protein